jgi:hypothetical protein
MQKIVLFVLTLSIFTLSCDKTVKQGLVYTVTNDAQDSIMKDIFIPDSGTYTMPVKVKFFTGYQNDYVKLVLTGLPSDIKVTPDTFTSIPNFTENFVFYTYHVALGVHPVTLTAYTETAVPQIYNFNLTVIPADCAKLFWGNLVGTSACTSRSYTSAATGVSSGTTNKLIINNFAGYGLHCDVVVDLNCDNDSLHIAYANYGNGVMLSGSGIFTADSMVINYVATSIPTGGGESCTITYKK